MFVHKGMPDSQVVTGEEKTRFAAWELQMVNKWHWQRCEVKALLYAAELHLASGRAANLSLLWIKKNCSRFSAIGKGSFAGMNCSFLLTKPLFSQKENHDWPSPQYWVHGEKRGAERSGTGIVVLLQPDAQAVLLETSESLIWFYSIIVSFLLMFRSEQSYSTALMPSNPCASTCPTLRKEGFVFPSMFSLDQGLGCLVGLSIPFGCRRKFLSEHFPMWLFFFV